jgi:hypothetical protein
METADVPIEVPINIIGDLNEMNELNNINTGDEASGGISRWLIYTIIILVVAAVVGLAIFIVKKINDKKRDSGGLIKEVSNKKITQVLQLSTSFIFVSNYFETSEKFLADLI